MDSCRDHSGREQGFAGQQPPGTGFQLRFAPEKDVQIERHFMNHEQGKEKNQEVAGADHHIPKPACNSMEMIGIPVRNQQEHGSALKDCQDPADFR